MKFIQVTAAFIALIGCGIATGYASGEEYDGGVGAGGGYSGYVGGAGVGVSRRFGGGAAEDPKPYNFDYTSNDGEGNTHYRNEQGDEQGNVRGTYGYTDVQGLYRIIEYVADANGFRANIRSNEPGVDGKESPADVVLIAEEPPAGIQDKYTSAGGAGGYGYGGGSRGARQASSGVSYDGGVGAGGGYARGGAGVRSGKSGY